MSWKFWKRWGTETIETFGPITVNRKRDSISFNIWELENGKLYPIEWGGEAVFLRKIDSTTVEALIELTDEKALYLSNLASKAGIQLDDEIMAERGLKRICLLENCLTYRETVNMLLGFDKDTQWG